MTPPQSAAVSSRPRRVLHIVESIDRGAVENWLLRLYRFAREQQVPLDWTFYCILPNEGRREAELRDLGARVVRSSVTLGNTAAFARELRSFAAGEHFDVVHAHHDVLSGFYLLALTGVSIERRIVHVHNADLSLPTPNPRKARLLGALFSWAVRRRADAIVGISQYVVDQFVERIRVRRERCAVLLYGVDTEPFRRQEGMRDQIRESADVGTAQRALLFIGRLTWFKNPVFVVDVAAALKQRGEDVVALFAGTGPEEPAIVRRATELGLQDAIRLLGWRDDGAALMLAADAFVFPREERETADVGKEGLGLTVVEAQAAGLPTIVSRAIPHEALVVRDLCRVVPLDAGASVWSEAVSSAMAHPRPSVDASTRLVDSSPLSMARSLDAMMKLHERRGAA